MVIFIVSSGVYNSYGYVQLESIQLRLNAFCVDEIAYLIIMSERIYLLFHLLFCSIGFF